MCFFVRILGEPSNHNRRQRPCLEQANHLSPPNVIDDTSLPPAYSTVLADPTGQTTESSYTEIGPRVLYNSQTHRSHTLEMQRRKEPSDICDFQPVSNRVVNTISTMNSRRPPLAASTLTATDVAQFLRPTATTNTEPVQQRTASLGECVDESILNTLRRSLSRSADNLVLNAVPPGESSIIDLNIIHNDDDDDIDRYNCNSNTSVI